jgi:hypothetical protein
MERFGNSGTPVCMDKKHLNCSFPLFLILNFT